MRLTKHMAFWRAPFGRHVTAIWPGGEDDPVIRADIAAKAQAMDTPVNELARAYEQQASLGRMVSARYIANMALFAASPAASSVSGQALAVDGHTQALVCTGERRGRKEGGRQC